MESGSPKSFEKVVMFRIYPMALVQLIWVPPTELPELAPTLFEFTTQLAIFFLSFDFTYFWFHYVMHKVSYKTELH